MKKYFLVTLFISLFFLPRFLVKNTSSVLQESVYSLSSKSASQCQSLFNAEINAEKNIFDQRLFQDSLQKFNENNFLKPKDFSEFHAPEEALALIEALSKTSDHQNIDISNFLETASEKQILKLLKATKLLTAKSKISSFEVESILIKIYKILNPPTGLYRAIKNKKTISTAISFLSDQALIQRLELSLARKGLVEAFSEMGFLRKANTIERFRSYLKEQNNIIRLSFFAILNLPLVFHGYAPSYLPAYSNVNSKKIDHAMELVMEQGFDRAFPTIQNLYKNNFKRDVYLKYIRKSYNFIATSVIVLFMTQSLTHTINSENLKNLQKFQSTVELIQNFSEISTVVQTPEKQADILYQGYLEMLKKNGITYDEDSSEITNIKEKIRSSFVIQEAQ